ncbi:MAG: DUF882 domain-containing protein [Proteobacteria bacterium]|nr:DUF882 domain-containing protein [Pseudomonadota bacterium]
MTIDRRGVLTVIAGGLVLAAGFPHMALAKPEPAARALSLINLHTGERFCDTYCEQGETIPEALDALNKVLRDHRSGDVETIDPKLFDWMNSLQKRLGGTEFGIISGYRSPKTNAQLRANSSGVAKKSWHMKGQAIDLRLSGVDTAAIREMAIADQRGGVGYYAKSDFVHIDTGRPRSR